jgi:hypothetical protein
MDKDELDIMIFFWSCMLLHDIKINFPDAILKEKYLSHQKE